MPSYNHSREDGPYHPCAICARELASELIVMTKERDRFRDLVVSNVLEDQSLTTEQRGCLIELSGLDEQIRKQHFLNVHFRAFELAHRAWREHVRLNAVASSEMCNSPGGAVLNGDRDGGFKK